MSAIDGLKHSRCVQTRIGAPAECASAFNSSGANGDEICLVAAPDSAADMCCGCGFCCQPYVAVPSGFFILFQRWYKNMGEMTPGVKLCWPFWYRISHIINKATITYSAPSRNVPTADNVFVDVNLSLTFSIGPGIEDASDFVYKLGTVRFDEFLSNEVEEGIRGLVYSVTHDRVNDLREEFAQGMLQSLSRKFKPYGVQIRNVKITETALPRELAFKLEETTTFRTRIAEKAKKHENTIRVLADQASQELETIVRTNMRREQDLSAQCVRYQIQHQEKIDEMVGSARVQEIGAKSRMDVLIGQAKGDYEVAQAEGEKEAEVIRKNMQIDCERRKVKIEEQAAVMILESEGQLRAAENNAQALIAEAEAENNSTAGLEVKRKYELEWERLAILEKLAKEGRRFISGSTGAGVMREMVPTSTSMAKTSGKTYF
mmetsp:Transcript_30905/g.80790  ORF Transcript_30905/g.80790 Transcript_30905/m.80790 type:complete len:432 (-) Transcript_30905:469-1764(-)